MAFLHALGVYDEKWPPYASNVRIELYKNTVNFMKELLKDPLLTMILCVLNVRQDKGKSGSKGLSDNTCPKNRA